MLIHLFGFVTFILILPIKCERLNSIGSTKTSSMNASILVDLKDDNIDTTKDNYSKYRSMKECPFPPAYIIDPCKCFADERYRAHLVCNLERNMDADFLSNLIDSFGCKNEIFSFEVNLNGFAWETDFSKDNFGRLQITKFILENAALVSNIQAGALTSSTNSIREFTIAESTYGSPINIVRSGAFENLDNLQIVELGNHFSQIENGAFANLLKLKEIRISKSTISVLQSQAFQNIGITEIDLSEQLLDKIQSKTFSNLPNITKIDLSSNMLSSISDDAFMTLPSLTNLDLSNNSLCRLGGAITDLKNPDLVVNLSNNKITYMIEKDFKPYIETRKNKGYIDFTGNRFHCKCDFKWLSLTTFRWNDLLTNGTCNGGKTFDQVDAEILTKMCPDKTCGSYNDELGRMTKNKLQTLEFKQTSTYTCNSNQHSTIEYQVESKADYGFLSVLSFSCHYYSKIKIVDEETNNTIDVSKNTNTKIKVALKKFKIQIRDLRHRHQCTNCHWNIQWEAEEEEEPDYCF